MRWRTALAAVVAIATGYVFADVAIAQGPDEGRSALLYQVSVVGVHRASHEPVVPQKPVPEYTWDANYQQPRLTESAWEAILRWSGWPEALIPEAKAISWCESHWIPTIRGDNGAAVGTFQTHVRDRAWAPYVAAAGGDIEDPFQQATVARWIYELRGRWGGLGGWANCSVITGFR